MWSPLQALLLLAKVQKGADDPASALETQMQARDLQASLINKLRGDAEQVRRRESFLSLG